MKPGEDSEQILRAKQAINAYEHQRAIGNVASALEHLKRAIDAIMLATFALEDEITKGAR